MTSPRKLFDPQFTALGRAARFVSTTGIVAGPRSEVRDMPVPNEQRILCSGSECASAKKDFQASVLQFGLSEVL
jgi:hypothetical protein